MSSHENSSRKDKNAMRRHLPKFLIAAGLILGALAIFAATGWIQGLLLALATVSCIASYWLSYMENAGPN